MSSVAASISGPSNNPQFEADLNGYVNSLLIMSNPVVANRFAAAYPDINGDGNPDVVTADVIVVDVAEGGDLAGEGFLPRVADGIVHQFDVMVIAPTGDTADAVGVPPQQRQQYIFTQTLYAPASGHNVMGVGAQDFPAGAMSMGGTRPRVPRPVVQVRAWHAASTKLRAVRPQQPDRVPGDPASANGCLGGCAGHEVAHP